MWETLCSCLCQVDVEIQMGCENKTGKTKTEGVQWQEEEQQSLINPLLVYHNHLYFHILHLCVVATNVSP